MRRKGNLSNDSFLTQEEIDALLGKKEQPEEHSSFKGRESLGFDTKDEEYRNLDLILDFPLVLSVRLGEIKKSIKEIRRMVPGMVLELDHPINDSLEVYVGDKLIARGEVVVIQEHFGIKITGIIDPVDRINRLR
jgi:flagellar motor switch protein FliN/FliY